MTDSVSEEFIGEPLRPVPGTMDVRGMARGEPGVPGRFTWRGAEHTVVAVLERWKETGPCTSGSGERYVRKHWFRIRTAAGHEMRIYFERQARSAREKKSRWWVSSVSA